MELSPGEQAILDRAIIVTPAFNEEACIGSVVDEYRRAFPATPHLVVSDASRDRTREIALGRGARVLNLPCNLGVGGAVQAGFQYALCEGFGYAIRCDADGQHPASEVPALLRVMAAEEVDLVIGSRYLDGQRFRNTILRGIGIRYLAAFLSRICHHPVTDPTSGFMILNRLLMRFLADRCPFDYPEPESLAMLRRQGYAFREAPVRFASRQGGRSSIGHPTMVYYALKVTLALLVDRTRAVDKRYDRQRLVAEGA